MLKIKNLFILVLSLFTLTAFAGETPQISSQDLLAVLDKGNDNIVLLDVRSAGEYQHSHITYQSRPDRKKLKTISTIPSKHRSCVVVYCRSGRRAGIAEQILSSNGFSDVRHLTGDMNGWLEEKLPVTNSEHTHE